MQRKRQSVVPVPAGPIETLESAKEQQSFNGHRMTQTQQSSKNLHENNNVHRMTAKVPKKAMMKQLPPKERFAPRQAKQCGARATP